MERKFPLYLPFNKERTYSILGYLGEVTEYRDNKGYINRKTGKIYICSKDNPPVHKDVPIVYVKDDNSYELHDVASPRTSEVFREEYMYDLSYESIIKNSSVDDVLYDEEALSDMNAATSVFVPIINEDDDPLKKLIKQVIIDKKIDINCLKHKMPQKYGLTNMKSALVGKTKMSITNFNIWCELLGITYEITMIDNGTDGQHPLEKIIHYDSSTNRIIQK